LPFRGASLPVEPAKTLLKGVAAVTTAAPAILPIIFLLFILLVLKIHHKNSDKYDFS
jgi:hypothetical protein